ncbi:MAG: calcium-binding protein, partial [Novosphingobium sp.]
ADIAVSRDADGNLVLALVGSDDRVTLVDPAGNEAPVVGTIAFADGGSVTYQALAAGIMPTDGDDHIIVPSDPAHPDTGAEIYGGLGNDRIEGGTGADVITGGFGNDLLEGGSGADTYYFARGDGQDTIVDVEARDASRLDTLRFGPGILPSDIEFLTVGPDDIVIGIAGTGDRLTLRDMFRAGTSKVDYGVEQFVFTDGTTWDFAAIMAAAAQATSGDDVRDFGATLDVTATLDGGAGDDVLAGGPGDTTYKFGLGYGHDIIREAGTWTGSDDTLVLGSGIAAADLVVVTEGNDLVLRLKGSDDRLTILGQAAASRPPVDHVVFADGTNWTSSQLQAAAVTPEAAEALLHPSDPDADPFGGDIFAHAPGGGGAGSAGSSTIGLLEQTAVTQEYVEGLGLAGSASTLGNGTYQLTPNSSNKVGAVWGRVDLSSNVVWTTRMYFGASDSGADGMSFAVQNVSGTALTGAGGGGMGTLVSGSFGIVFDTWGQSADFSQFVYNAKLGDNTYDPRHDYANLEDAAWHDVVITWDAASSRFSYSVDGVEIGSKTADVVNELFGGKSEVWYGFGGATGGSANDQEVQIVSIETVQNLGADPASIGKVGQIGSGLYERKLAGAAARNTYDVFVPVESWGDHVDTIVHFTPGDAGDRLSIAVAEGLDGDVLAGADGADTLIYFAEAGTLRLEDARVLLRLKNVTPDTLTGVNFAGGPFERIVDETINGTGDADVATGGWGNDTIATTWGADTLSGGPGNDNLQGGGDNDVYLFGRGSGQDTITDRRVDYDFYSGGYDAVLFGEDVAWEDLAFSTSGKDLIIAIAGTEDRIRIVNGFRNTNYRVEEFRFADGTVKTYADITAVLSTGDAGDNTLVDDSGSTEIVAGAGNDTVSAYWGNDRIIGGTGDDTLHGGGDNDVYVFNRGDGRDTISDRRDDYDFYSGGSDAIEFGEGIAWDDLRLRRSGNDLYVAIAGTEDRIRIVNGFRNANYRIEEFRFADGTVRSYDDITARLHTGGDGDDTLADDSGASTIVAGDGNDTVSAYWGADRIVGGRGNDTLYGGGDDDVYVFSRGDGQDYISDRRDDYDFYSGGNDAVEFGEGIAWDDLIFTRSGSDLLVQITGTEDGLRIYREIDNTNYRVEEFRFADGTVKTFDDVLAALDTSSLAGVVAVGVDVGEGIIGTDAAERLTATGFNAGTTLDGRGGYDELTGSAYDDVLIGGAGNDRLSGGVGNDIYRFAAGFGQDQIDELTSNGGLNAIEFAEGLSPDDLVIRADYTDLGDGVYDFGAAEILFAGTEDRIRIADFDTIAEIRFADGTALDRQAMASLSVRLSSGQNVIDYAAVPQPDILAGGAGDDSIYGDTGNDTLLGHAGNDYIEGGDGADQLEGGTGNDVLRGGAGADVYRFSAGFGHDIVNVDDNGLDWIQFDNTILPDDVAIERGVIQRPQNGWSDDYSLFLRVRSTGDVVQIPGIMQGESSRSIAGVSFADETTWSFGYLFEVAEPTGGIDLNSGGASAD